MMIRSLKLSGKTSLPIIVVAMLMMVSCQGSVIKIGYRCFNSPQKLDCQYRQFTGRDVATEELQPSDNLELSYEVEIKIGFISIQVVAPDETILWRSEFAVSGNSNVVILVNQEGVHQIVVAGDDTRGGYLIEWSIQ